MHFFLRAACAIPLLFVTFAAVADDTSLDEVVVTAELRDHALRDFRRASPCSTRTRSSSRVCSTSRMCSGSCPISTGRRAPRVRASFRLRGIGELEQWQGAPNPSVGFLIDGVDFSGIGMPAMLSDVERIEVLRGPQGTAYGANALAGLIAVNTRKPQREYELSANITVADYGTLGASGVLGGPVGEGEAAWRLVAGNYRSDGFRHDAYLDRDDTNGYDESSARFKLHTRPSENLSADFTAMWADLDNGYDAFAIDNSRTTLSDKPGQDTQLARALAVRLDYSGADAFDVVSRTTAGTSRSVYSFDGDWGNDAYWGENAPYDYFQRFDRERRTLSEDLRLVSRGNVDHGASFAWLAGVYALRTDEDVQQHDVYHDLLFGDGDLRALERLPRNQSRRLQRTRVAAQDATVLSAGARVEQRRPTTGYRMARPFRPMKPCSAVRWSCGISSANARSAYLKFARGYKAGGFNIGDAVPEDRRTFDTEVLHSLEVGLRSANVDASLAGDVALFYMRREDQQVQTGEQLEPGESPEFRPVHRQRGERRKLRFEATLQLAARRSRGC